MCHSLSWFTMGTVLIPILIHYLSKSLINEFIVRSRHSKQLGLSDESPKFQPSEEVNFRARFRNNHKNNRLIFNDFALTFFFRLSFLFQEKCKLTLLNPRNIEISRFHHSHYREELTLPTTPPSCQKAFKIISN